MVLAAPPVARGGIHILGIGAWPGRESVARSLLAHGPAQAATPFLRVCSQ